MNVSFEELLEFLCKNPFGWKTKKEDVLELRALVKAINKLKKERKKKKEWI